MRQEGRERGGRKDGQVALRRDGKVVDKCCCEPREGGKMYCTLAKKEIDKCCCTEVKAGEKEVKQS